MKVLEIERLILRPLALSDAPSMYEAWANDKEVTKFLTWKSHKSVGETRKVLEGWIKEYENQGTYRFGLVEKESGKLIGMIDVIGYHHGNPVLGAALARVHWNKGYITEALRTFTSFLFQEGFTTIVAEAVRENYGSNKAIEKSGFKLVKTYMARIADFDDKLYTKNSYRLYKDDK